jgi:hypothetical protein
VRRVHWVKTWARHNAAQRVHFLEPPLLFLHQRLVHLIRLFTLLQLLHLGVLGERIRRRFELDALRDESI